MTAPSSTFPAQDIRKLLGVECYSAVLTFIRLLQQTKYAMLMVAVAERRTDDDVAQQRRTTAEAQRRCTGVRYALWRIGNVDADNPFGGDRDNQARLAQDLRDLTFLLAYPGRIAGLTQLREISSHEDIYMPLGALTDLLRKS